MPSFSAVIRRTPLKYQVAAFALLHCLLLLALSRLEFSDFRPSESPLYFLYSSRVFSGELPYRDFNFEYPPLSMLFFLLPRLCAGTVQTYSWAFTAELFLFDLLTLVLLGHLSRQAGISS